MTGKVWLLGAGPGDPSLLTLRGKQVLSQADVVVYDALVGSGVLAMIPEGTRRVYVGKRSSNHAMPQEDINRVLLTEAQEGNRVVRLKGGDPFLFGRGGEELELLSANGIPFEVIPGVTSAFAVPAYNGIPVTHRNICSSVHIITGHRKEGGREIDYEALVRAQGTLVFLMGIAEMPEIQKGLLRAGMPEDTPAAVLSKGTTAHQKRILTTLGALTRDADPARVETPAIIVVGEVCSLAEDFSWYEKRPLAGYRFAVTRPRESVSVLSSMLREQGAEVLELPAIRTVASWQGGEIGTVFRKLQDGGYDWVVFTSPAGVRIFFEMLFAESDIRALSCVKVAAIGEGSAKALLKYGIRADFVPSVYDGETLGRELAVRCTHGERLLIPRAAIGNRELITELEKGDALEITDLATYDTVYESAEAVDLAALIKEKEIDFAVFTSASTVRGFAAAAGEALLPEVYAICIGAQTAAQASAYGMRVSVAKEATLQALCECAEETVRMLGAQA